jgi:hypothetical protein
LFDAVRFDRVEQEAARRAAFMFDLADQPVQARLVGAPCQAGVVAVAREALGDMAADAGAGTENEA